MRRRPADTCLSIYATPNRAAISFAGDRDAIACAYRCYLELMDHWRRVLPANRLLDIDYESLVSDPEATIRKVLEFIELDWDPKLLHHELNARSVLTPSLWQVRRPIYSSSVGRWKSFEPYLGPFQSLIDAGQN